MTNQNPTHNPLRTIELFKLAINLYRKTYVKILPYCLILVLLIISFIILPILTKENDSALKQVNNIQDNGTITTITFILLGLVFFGMFSVVLGAMIQRTHSILQERDPGFLYSLGAAFRRIVPLSIGTFSFLVPTIIGFSFMVVPGILFAIFFVLSLYLAGIGRSPKEAIKENLDFIYYHARVLFINVGFTYLLSFILLILIAILSVFILGSIEKLSGTIFGREKDVIYLFTLIIAFASVIISPFANANLMIILQDLQLRNNIKTS